jgi:hypothetical protein
MRALWLVFVVVIVALTRLIPHPPNFTPLFAIALFCGAKAPNRWVAYGIPVVALWLSDLILGVHDLMLVVAAALVASAAIGQWVESQATSQSRNWKIGAWALAGLNASVLFFLASNFAVWQTSGMYPHTSEGLWTCFIMGLPFFHNQVLATWIFSGALFSAWSVLVESKEKIWMSQ